MYLFSNFKLKITYINIIVKVQKRINDPEIVNKREPYAIMRLVFAIK